MSTTLSTPSPSSGEACTAVISSGGRITLRPSGRSFDCGPGETVLDAALRAGVAVPYQCRTGSCGSCRAGWVAGDFQELPSDGARQRGVLLLCRTQVCGDLDLACAELAAGQSVRKLPVRVQQLERLAEDVMAITLQPPPGQTLEHLAGQYVDVLLPRGVRRSYSLARPAAPDGSIELHVRRREAGLFTSQVFDRLKPRDMLRLEGPFGNFGPRGDAQRPALLLATGTGFAPIKAMVEQAIAAGAQRLMTLYWGGRQPADLYLDGLCRRWAGEHPWFGYVPVLSRATAAHGWNGRTGHVHEAALADLPDLSGHEVYACGSPAMVAAASALFLTAGRLAPDAFFSDAFTPATHLAMP